MRLSEIKGERAFKVLADLLDPIGEIIQDREFTVAWDTGTKLDAIKVMLKKHPDSCRMILALLDGEDPDTYEVSLVTLPKKMMEIIDDPELMGLFSSQSQ